VHAEAVEGREQVLLEGVPEAQLVGHAVVEPAQHALAVGALGGRGEAEQTPRAEVAEQAGVAGGLGVVELVDHDDLVEVGVEGPEAPRGQGLGRREDLRADGGPRAVDEELAEGGVAQHGAVDGEALLEDLLAVRDEEQGGAPAAVELAGVVEGGGPGLAGAGRGDDEVAGVAAVPLGLQRVEHAALVRLGLGVEVEEERPFGGGGAQGAGEGADEVLGVGVGREVAPAAGPQLLEGGREALQQLGGARRGHPDVPLHALGERGAGEVRRADVRGRQP